MIDGYPLVSIIIPVYNCEKYIHKCIHTVMLQSWPSIQLIVVNDGSTDRSGDIINSLAAKHNNITIINQINQGVAAARNKGVSHAKGEYLLFIDGDDYISRDYVEKLTLQAIAEEAELVICGYTLVRQGGLPYRIVSPVHHQKGDEAWAYRICAAGSRLYRKDFWDRYELKFLNEKNARGEDVPLSLFANAMAANIAIIRDSGYYYVQHEGSAMHAYKGFRKYHFPYRTVAALLNKVKDMPLTNRREWFNFGILKFFAQFVFALSGGAPLKEIRRLCSYIDNMVAKYFAEAWQELRRLYSDKPAVPLAHKWSIYIMLVLLRLRMLTVIIWLCSRRPVTGRYKKGNRRRQ